MTTVTQPTLFTEVVQLVRLAMNGSLAALLEPATVTPAWARFLVDDLHDWERTPAGVEPCIARIERLLAIAAGQAQLFTGTEATS